MSPKTPFRTGDQALVREINLSHIMQRLFTHSTLSRSAMAEMTGLNKSTVSSLVQELIDTGFVREVGVVSGNVGRPSILLELNPQAGYIVSCELGVDFISLVCTNFGAEVLWQHREDMRSSRDQQVILERMLALVREALDAGKAHCADRCGLMGLALGVPGLVDEASGTLLFAPNLAWQNVPLRDVLSKAFEGVPVFVDNEANMAALGENLYGAAKGYHEVLFISAGVGLGGAIVRDGQLLRGTTGFAGEFGHMTMDPDGEPCNCGNRGCWETQVSQSAVFRYIRQAIQRGQTSALQPMTGGDLDQLSIPLVVTAAEAGDPVALEAFERVGRSLGIGIASLVNALNPDRIVFGGILSLAGSFLLPVMEAELQRRALRWNREAARIALAQHGSDACLMGGVAVICQSIIAQPGKY
jgi:glucokinase-like ROK family protein